jgi:hypothetical protein
MWGYLAAVALMLPLVGPAPVSVGGIGEPASATTHFKLLGPDWARIPEGYFGVVPEIVVTELTVPREYLARRGPQQESQSNVAIEVFFPSMSGAAGAQSSEAKINLIIHAAREDGVPTGIQRAYSDGVRQREPSLDKGDLCAYVDHQSPGYAGDEFYLACDRSIRTFDIICFPQFNNRRVCSEVAFLDGKLGAQLFYQYPLLSDHGIMLDAVRKLVMSFVAPSSAKP